MDRQFETAVTTVATGRRPNCVVIASLGCLLAVAGCYAPLHSPGIPARHLSDEYRWPSRTSCPPLNYSSLVAPRPATDVLGSGDLLQITVSDLISLGHLESLDVRVQENGEISLPRLGPVFVGGLTVSEARDRINDALAAGLIQNPSATVSLLERGTIDILVLGAVQKPGVYPLPRNASDVAHALAAAEGFSEEAGDVIEVHRRVDVYSHGQDAFPQPAFHAADHSRLSGHAMPASLPSGARQPLSAPPATEQPRAVRVTPAVPATPLHSRPVSHPKSRYGHLGLPVIRGQSPGSLQRYQTTIPGTHFAGQVPPPTAPLPVVQPITRIPLRGDVVNISPDDVILREGDVVLIPPGKDKVFYVVGLLSEQNRLRFSVGDKDREIGNGLLLPDDREVDVVTAVAMAGYIDPIESPTTVTVHRIQPNGMPILIRVDLIAARSDPLETILIQPGDIVYLNPDAAWYSRRTMDRVIERALGTAVGRWLTN